MERRQNTAQIPPWVRIFILLVVPSAPLALFIAIAIGATVPMPVALMTAYVTGKAMSYAFADSVPNVVEM